MPLGSSSSSMQESSTLKAYKLRFRETQASTSSAKRKPEEKIRTVIKIRVFSFIFKV